MSKSPAMINRAKRIAYKQLICHFKNKEYSTYIPTKPEMDVKTFLEAFSESNFEGDYQYHDIEMYKENEYLPYDHILHEDNFEPTYKLHFSELTKKNFLENAKFDKSASWFEIFGLDEKGDSKKDSGNFFEYLIDEFPEFRVSEDNLKKNIEMSNLVNIEAAKHAQEENSKKFTNQWLYNSNSASLITPLNIQSWDMFYYKNMLTQILSQFISINNNALLDVNYKAKGLHTKETNSDFVLKSRKNNFNLPITVSENINEVEIFDKLRTTLYDFYFPKLYPMFAYEFVDPNDHDAETISKANFVNQKMCKFNLNK